jgi:hypothetical protein
MKEFVHREHKGYPIYTCILKYEISNFFRFRKLAIEDIFYVTR